MKLLCLALLLLPCLASADDSPQPFGRAHVGAAMLVPDSDDMNAGGALLLDGEGGLRFQRFDLTAWGSYLTKHVDGEVPDDIFDPEFAHYRMHLIDVGVRASVHGDHVYGGLGIGEEFQIERGTSHFTTPTSHDKPSHYYETHAVLELRGGYTLSNHIDLFGALGYTKNNFETMLSGRIGVGFRF
ncbi:MAG: hypothetical protein JO257_03675 [Deltaproteobacteria bacterium]|nr:hypothetical protein [Deltaproteobacteria bacterium]